MRLTVLGVLVTACAASPSEPVRSRAPGDAPAPAAHATAVSAATAGEAASGSAGAEAVSPEAEAPCPAADHGPHCVWIATRPPNAFRANLVAKKLTKQGYAAFGDGDRIIVHATDEQLRSLLGADVSHERRAASSSDGTRCVAAVGPDHRLPASIRGEVGDFIVDDPTCEL
ncbi:MAG: hypothetical protein KF718_12665 [Polyangiaceae bacterium]|nr:hypothetical protein [Polyangiaceae bacterium]